MSLKSKTRLTLTTAALLSGVPLLWLTPLIPSFSWIGAGLGTGTGTGTGTGIGTGIGAGISAGTSGISAGIVPGMDSAIAAPAKLFPPPPRDQGRPQGSRRGGATRSIDCKVETPSPSQQVPLTAPLTALVPGNDPPPANSPTSPSNRTWAMGQTTASHPTLWFHSPHPLRPASTDPLLPASLGRFRLRDANRRLLYEAWIQTRPNESGIFAVQLPSTLPALTVGQAYQWSLATLCGDQTLTFVQGTLVRIALPSAVSQQIQNASERDRLILLGQQSLWYDLLNQLAQTRLSQPKTPQGLSNWQQILSDVDLQDLSNRPLITITQTPTPNSPSTSTQQRTPDPSAPTTTPTTTTAPTATTPPTPRLFPGTTSTRTPQDMRRKPSDGR